MSRISRMAATRIQAQARRYIVQKRLSQRKRGIPVDEVSIHSQQEEVTVLTEEVSVCSKQAVVEEETSARSQQEKTILKTEQQVPVDSQNERTLLKVLPGVLQQHEPAETEQQPEQAETSEQREEAEVPVQHEDAEAVVQHEEAEAAEQRREEAEAAVQQHEEATVKTLVNNTQQQEDATKTLQTAVRIFLAKLKLESLRNENAGRCLRTALQLALSKDNISCSVSSTAPKRDAAFRLHEALGNVLQTAGESETQSTVVQEDARRCQAATLLQSHVRVVLAKHRLKELVEAGMKAPNVSVHVPRRGTTASTVDRKENTLTPMVIFRRALLSISLLWLILAFANHPTVKIVCGRKRRPVTLLTQLQRERTHRSVKNRVRSFKSRIHMGA